MAVKTYRYKLKPPAIVVDADQGPVTFTNGVNIPTYDVNIEETVKSAMDERMSRAGWEFDQEVV